MTPRLRKAALGALAVLALALLSVDVARVVARLRFDYDLLLWGDDYFMTSMEKLAAGLPVYTPIADGNSTVYSPGGPWLHHLLLAPFGASTALLPNRLLNLAWLGAALAVATRATEAFLARTPGVRVPADERALVRLLLFSTLGVTALANPVTDSLHPTNLELLVLSAALLAFAVWDELAPGWALVLALLLPAAALLVKQTAGVALAAAFALLFVLERKPRAALLPVGALAATFVALCLGTRGLFATWGFSVLAHHPFDWWKVSDLYAGYFLLFLPSVLTVCGAAFVSRATLRSSAFFRGLLLLLAYLPPSLAALFKTMGGPNNLALPGFLLVVLGLPFLLGPLLSPGGASARARALPLLLAAQLGVLYPRRRVPSAHDEDNARTICGYAARRMQCGERVHLGRGSVCYLRGGVRVPTDRLSSIVEVTVAGRASELGFFERVRASEYDVLIVPMNDLLWFGSSFWASFRERYVPFFQTEGALENDFWFDGWQGYVSWPMVFFERRADRGRHHVDPGALETAPCSGSEGNSR